MAEKRRKGGLVYSSDEGAMCPGCSRPVDQCECTSGDAVPETDGVVRVRREVKGRKGKGVTVVTGVPLTAAALVDLAKKLKKKCGTGGTVKDGTIEIQGDHRERLMTELRKLGWTVKPSGG